MLVQNEHPAAQEYLNPPKLPAHLEFYFMAFWDLSGTEGIPFTDLHSYAQRYGIDGVDEFELFASLVRTLNGEWIKAINKQPVELDETTEEVDPPRPAPRPKALKRN